MFRSFSAHRRLRSERTHRIGEKGRGFIVSDPDRVSHIRRVYLQAFDINIHALRIAGGIFIFGIAYNLLNAKQSHVQSLHHAEHRESKEKEDISVTPLSIPIISGPGTIATVMSLSAGSRSLVHFGGMIIGIAAVLLLTFAAFHYSTLISNKLGQTEMNVITRLMGLILAVVAVGMIGTGLKGMFPVLAG